MWRTAHLHGRTSRRARRRAHPRRARARRRRSSFSTWVRHAAIPVVGQSMTHLVEQALQRLRVSPARVGGARYEVDACALGLQAFPPEDWAGGLADLHGPPVVVRELE